MSVIFFDTEKQDQQLVLSHFPDATFAARGLPASDLISLCKDAEIISTFITTAFPREVLLQLPKLKLLLTRSVGFDHIDVPTCIEKGITVCNVPDYGSHVIAEHVFALLLSTLRHIPAGNARVESGTFDYHGLRGMALKDKTIGIVGTGKIGRRVARIARGFDMNILAVDQCRTLELEEFYGVHYTMLDDLLAHSDIVSLHVPAFAETKHMINKASIAKMKDGVILVNTARGSLIKSDDLLEALNSGKVALALLDVLEHEENFSDNKALVDHPHVVTTPHIAFYADDSLRNMYMDCFQSIEQWKRGEKPMHMIALEKVVCDLPGVKKV